MKKFPQRANVWCLSVLLGIVVLTLLGSVPVASAARWTPSLPQRICYLGHAGQPSGCVNVTKLHPGYLPARLPR